MRTERPDRLYIRKNDLADFENLKKEKDSSFSGRENKEIFIMAMAYGFYNKSKIPLDKKEGYIREEYLNDDERSIIKAIAVYDEGDLNVLLNPPKVYSIAEEYAAGGIKYLKGEVFDKRGGSYIKKLEARLVEEFKKNKE